MTQAVLGCGRWGSFHLWYGSMIGNSVTGWEPEGIPGFSQLRETRKNRYLELPTDIRLTSDLEEVSGSDMVIVTVPAQKFRGLCCKLRQIDISAADLILCMKGIEKDTGTRLTEISHEEGLEPRSLSVWVGPGHPQQFIAGVPSCMIIASEDESDSVRIAGLLSSDLIRFYWSRDIIGCEVGAAAKNVIGIAAGILDGLNHSGLKGALMARAPQEVARLVAAMGGDWRSVYGLSHLGDYEATLFSPYSHNRMYGEAVARGAGMESLQLAEGVDTATAVMLLADRYNVEMPITSTVRKIINNEIPAKKAIEDLFTRPEKEEFADHF
ncbi:MAG: glycerol-3-phosphate dehydrogenase [Candidatus Aegiribacteria sp.]|nr:glycerol-3-phosphate dehydrogenase [Candidatus Aegiribacteria sp.]